MLANPPPCSMATCSRPWMHSATLELGCDDPLAVVTDQVTTAEAAATTIKTSTPKPKRLLLVTNATLSRLSEVLLLVVGGVHSICVSSQYLRLDNGNYLVATVSLIASKVHEFIYSCLENALSGRCHDANTASSCEVQEALVSQNVEGSNNGVLVYPDDFGEIDCGRQTLSRLRFTVGDGPTNLGRDLFVQGDRLVLVDFVDFHRYYI